MNQALQAVRQLLNVMDVQVPHAVIAKLLDTPVGQTIRGISDALDALNIRNEVYQLPRELLQELPTPFLTVLPRQTQQFYIVTQVNSQAIEFAGHKPMGLQQFFREWDGIALTAEKTAETPIYHKVLLRNCCDWLIRYHVLLLSLLPMLITVLLFYPLDLAKVLHMAITMLGVYVSFVLLDRQYHRSSLLERFCKIGRRVNCHKVEDVSGATKWGALQLCDLSFLLFSTLLLTAIIDLFNFTSASLPLLVIACPMTVFSVVLQLLVIRSVCLFCMAVDVLVWLDIILLIFQPWAFSIAGWRSLVVAASLSYVLWYVVRRMLMNERDIEQKKDKLTRIYQKELLDILLKEQPVFANIPDTSAEIKGNEHTAYTMHVIMHEHCPRCHDLNLSLPELSKKMKLVILSIRHPDVWAYCIQHHLMQTPTVMVNGHLLPELYTAEDLMYIL